MGSPPPTPSVVHLTPIHASVGVGSNQSSVFTATIDGGQTATLKFYYDRDFKQQSVGNTASYSTPSVDSTTAGNHVIRVTADNVNGSSEAYAYWPIVPCSPAGADIDFSIDRYKCCPNNDWIPANPSHRVRSICNAATGQDKKNILIRTINCSGWIH